MAYLIDGYNLLYALGVLHDRMGPTGLRKARQRLLGLLRAALGPDEAPAVTVVFDAARPPPGASAEEDFGGIHVRFAVHQEEADDLIEELIRHDSAPRNLTVVSNDHRIQQAARRRHCIVVKCEDYLDWLNRHRRQLRQRPPEEGEKQEKLSEAETRRWLDEFAGLADDPDLKELFGYYDFGEEELPP
jgi:predicted RNA-binding protein with PIN domain